ncbi:MAG: polysaccharide deacetylase family protein [Anaerocolumna sp.]
MSDLLKNIYICFPEGKHKCLTLSYDDGKEHDRRLIEIFNKNGIKGTFHINGGLLGNHAWGKRISFDEIKDLYSGHEVSAHTYSHPTIERSPLDQVIQQIIEDRKILEDACGYPVRGLSYPNGSYSDDIIKLLPACGIEYARIVGDSLDFKMPRNFLEWKSTCHHNHSDLMKLANNFIELCKTQYLYLMYVWGHSYEFDTENNWDVIENFCELVGNKNDIWYATNIEIVDYMNAAKNLKYTAKGDKVYNPSATAVWIEVNGEKFKINSGELVEL